MPPSTLLTAFDLRDASLSGSLTWHRGSPTLAPLAPSIVLALAILSITEIIIGTIWITSIESASSTLTFAQVIQPLIVPALSFFNTIPSLHLHVLARSNNPVLAMVFSGVLAALFLGSAVAFLPPCTGKDAPWSSASSSSSSLSSASALPNTNTNTNTDSDAHIPISAYQRTECPPGAHIGVWAAMVALQFISFVGYTAHFVIAMAVWRGLKEYEAGVRGGQIVELVDEEEKRRREEEARKRWREMRGDL